MGIKTEWIYSSKDKEWYIYEIDSNDNIVLSRMSEKEYCTSHPNYITLINSCSGPWGGSAITGNSLHYAINKNDVKMVHTILGNGKMTFREMYDYFHNKNFSIVRWSQETCIQYGRDADSGERKSSFADMVKEYNSLKHDGVVKDKKFNNAFKVALRFYERSEAERERILAENDRVCE